MTLRLAHYYGEDMTGIPYVNQMIEYCKDTRDLLLQAAEGTPLYWIRSDNFGKIKDPETMRQFAADYNDRLKYWRRQKRTMLNAGMADPAKEKVSGY